MSELPADILAAVDQALQAAPWTDWQRSTIRAAPVLQLLEATAALLRHQGQGLAAQQLDGLRRGFLAGRSSPVLQGQAAAPVARKPPSPRDPLRQGRRIPGFGTVN